MYESGCLHPLCSTHQRHAKLCVGKDKIKQSYGRPYFVCSEHENPCKFWQCGDIFGSQDLCVYTVWCAVNVKSRKMVRIRIVYFTAVRGSTFLISARGSNKNIVWSTPVSCCLPAHFNTDAKYFEETGETFQGRI